MSKYAPANEAGEKPYIVECVDWRGDYTKVVYAEDAASARYKAGMRGVGQYVRKVRRALASEIEGSK